MGLQISLNLQLCPRRAEAATTTAATATTTAVASALRLPARNSMESWQRLVSLLSLRRFLRRLWALTGHFLQQQQRGQRAGLRAGWAALGRRLQRPLALTAPQRG